MPFADLGAVRLHYRLDGEPHLPVLMLSNSLGTTMDMWEPQMEALQCHFRVLRYDTRGHGQSSVPDGPYNFDLLGGDVVALLDHLGLDRVHFCGLSMGGMTGMWLGIHQPHRIVRLALCNTSARTGSPEVWNARIDTVGRHGMDAVSAGVIDRWFTAGYQQRSAPAVAQLAAMLRATAPAGYAANCAAVRDMDFLDQLVSIAAPTLVISGSEDKATPPEHGREIAARIEGARHVELQAAHIGNWEQAGQFTAALVEFMTGGAMSEAARYHAGMSMRRAVLGEAYVERSITRRSAFNTPFQEMITRHAWGDIWTRPGLTRHTRSLLTIAMMIALNRNEELALHLRAAKNNGVTPDEIRETLLQAAIYAGVPAANSAFHLAETILAEDGQIAPVPGHAPQVRQS